QHAFHRPLLGGGDLARQRQGFDGPRRGRALSCLRVEGRGQHGGAADDRPNEQEPRSHSAPPAEARCPFYCYAPAPSRRTSTAPSVIPGIFAAQSIAACSVSVSTM